MSASQLEILKDIIAEENRKPDRIVNFKPNTEFIDKCEFKRIIELGVRDGLHFTMFANSKAEEIIACDLWLDSDNIYENDKCFSQEKQDTLYNNLVEKYKEDERIQIIKHDSSSLADNYDDGYFDLVFVDADHSYEGSKKDIVAWYSKVREGGILCGHDYEKFGVEVNGKYYAFGVIDAVDEFVQENNIEDKLYVTPKKGKWGGGIPCWYIFK